MARSILYVGNDMRYFRLHRLSLAIAARNVGYEVHAALPSGEGQDELADSGIVWHKLPLKRGGVKLFSDIAVMLTLCRLYRALDPDIVHHHTIKPVIFGGICSRVIGVPRVVSGITGLGHVFVTHGVWAEVRRYLVKSAYRLALAHPQSRVVFQNRDDMRIFLRGAIVSSQQARLIRGSGVDLERFRMMPEQEGRLTVVLVSRMLWNKGIGDYVEAARRLKAQGVNARFLLVGDVDETNPSSISRQQMQNWHESGAIEWAGWVRDMASVYQLAHVVCLPSRYGEGVPRSLIEAAASGRPIVTTDTPGCREIVRDGENGYLVPVNDSTALANSFQRLFADAALRRRMGNKGREIAEMEFSLEIVVRDTLKIYEELLQ